MDQNTREIVIIRSFIPKVYEVALIYVTRIKGGRKVIGCKNCFGILSYLLIW